MCQAGVQEVRWRLQCRHPALVMQQVHQVLKRARARWELQEQGGMWPPALWLLMSNQLQGPRQVQAMLSALLHKRSVSNALRLLHASRRLTESRGKSCCWAC